MSCYSNEWPYYQDQISTSSSIREKYVLSNCTSNKSLMSNYLNDLRPTKKKSRCSKRQSPATILNADVSNFRALVQQLTGRPSEPTRLRAKKGPVNINFRQAKEVDDDPRVMVPFGCIDKYHHQAAQRESMSVQHKQHGFSGHREEVHHVMLSSFESQNSLTPTCIDDHLNRMSMEEFDDIDIDVDKCLEELASIDESGYHHQS